MYSVSNIVPGTKASTFTLGNFYYNNFFGIIFYFQFKVDYY